MIKTQFVLASSSMSRRLILEAAGVAFTVVAPEVDEDVIKNRLLADGADGATIAHTLAEAKALAVSKSHPNALVLGADQILICESRIFSKAIDRTEARATLHALRGKPHELISAAVIAKGGSACGAGRT